MTAQEDNTARLPDPLLLDRAMELGRVLFSQDDDLLKEVQAYTARAQNRFVEERRLPLWAKLYILIPILGLLGLEWYLRRRWGLA